MNCIIIDDDPIAVNLIKGYVNKTDSLSLVNSFSNPIDALSFMAANKIDLLFLDFEMPEMNGIEFIKAIKQQMPQIILVTAHKEFAADAFEYNVTDYLVKPIPYSRFFNSVQKAKEIFDKNAVHHMEADMVFVKKGSTILGLKKSDIIWVEALGDYAVLNTSTDKFTIHSTMNAVEKKLPAKDYIRVHRSFIVRIAKIDSIEDDAISCNEKLIPIGKSYRQEVYNRLNIL